jgi:subtilisin family serine protease
MSSVPELSRLWPRRSRPLAARRRSRVPACEQLEPRAMLAGITWSYVEDWVQTAPSFTTAPVFGTKGATNTYGNTEKGVLVLTIDGSVVDDPLTLVKEDNGVNIFLRVVNGNYQFAADEFFQNGIVTIPSGYASGYSLQTKDPDNTVNPVTAPVFTPFAAAFDTIYVRTANLVDGTDRPSFTILGASQNVTKSLVIDLTDSGIPLSDSTVNVGAPVVVAASAAGGVIGYQGDAATSPESLGGAIYMAAESIDIRAAVSSQNNLTLASAIGAHNLATNVVPAGITINQAVTVPGLVTATVSGTAFNVNAGGSIGNGASGAAALVMDLQDADARIVGSINAVDQSYFIMPSALLPADVAARTLTTRSASTGVQTGTLAATQLIVYLANDVQAAGADGSVDVQTAVGNLRITSTPGTLLDYDITIQNKTSSLMLDAVSASEGDITISNTGTIDLQAAIDTIGLFSISTAADFDVDSVVKSASGIVLTSTGGTLTTNAAIQAADVAGPGTILLSASKNVTVNSLVSSPTSVQIVSTAGAIKSGANLALDPTSRATAPSLSLSAATGIDLGTSTQSLDAVVTGAGALKVDDVDISEIDPLAPSWGGLVVVTAATVDGDVAVESTQSIDAQQLDAGGTGNIGLTSTGGDITLGTVIATANVVSLTAAEFDSAANVLFQGRITGSAPFAAEISWTAADVVDGGGFTDSSLYRNIPVISAHRLSEGAIMFTADNSVTLKSIKTTDGDVGVISTAGSIVATSIEAVGVSNNGAVGLAANGGSVTLGAIVADGSVAVVAAQDIIDDGAASTAGITAGFVNLSAASAGVVGSIGTETNRVSLASPAMGMPVAVTVSKAVQPGALDAQSVYLTAAVSISLNADAVDIVDIQTTGVQSDLDAQSVNTTDPDGRIVLASGRDLFAGALEVAGAAFGEDSIISLRAARGITIVPAPGGSLQAETLSLTAAQFPGQTDLTDVDDVNHFVVEATSASALDLLFDRPNDLILDTVKTASGNITIKNDGTGAILVGSGGVTAGTTASNNSVTITSTSSIDGYSSPAAGAAGAFGLGASSAASTAITAAVPSPTMTSGWERVSPLGSRTSSTSVVSWQGSAATAYTDRWVVKASSPAITAQSLLSGFRSRTATRTWTATSLGEGYYSVVTPRATQASVLAWANATPDLAFAQPDFVIRTAAVPNDPSYGQLWGLNNTTNPAADIDAPAAWDVTTGSRSTVVAVIDTGVDYNHPDLAANMWRNPGETPGDGIDNDSNGFIDDIYGWDFFNNDANPMDDHSHGTHCAGTIGAVGNNGVGVVGVNWQVSIMAMKFMGASNTGPLSAAISSLNYVTMMRRDKGVNVVATNNSWGGGNFNQTLKDSIKAGGDAGILFIASAGNTASDNDAVTRYPSGYDEPSIIAVAATDSSNNLASFSCFGATSVDVGAPGVDIFSTVPGGGYGLKSGTSMAAPHVAGLAALLASAYPKATASQIKSAILSSTVAIPALAGKVATGGLANAPAALAALAPVAGSGTITAAGLVTLTAAGDITASTAAGQLAATSGGAIDITQGGDVKIAGITAATSATLDVAGSVVMSSGKFLTSPLATVKATGGISLATDVDTLSAVSSGGNVTVVETNGLEVGADGIKASGTVGITLTAGNLDSSGGTISGSAVGIKLLAAGDLDVDTSAGSLTASTKDGHVTIRNDKGFTIGSAGIVAGNAKDVALTALAGGITGGTGAITAANATLTAAGGVSATTKVDALTATATAGDIAITQTGKAVTLTSLLAANGGITVTTNDDVTVTSVQAIGSGKNVSITATGTGKTITLVPDGIVADGDSVTLTASGAIVGTSPGVTPDVKAAKATLTAGGGDLEATLQAATVAAKASGNLDVTLLGSKTVFLTPTSGTVLSAGGDVTLRTGTNDVVVVAAPTAGAGKTTTYETTGLVTFAVTGTAATGVGSLAKAVADASAATINGGGSAGVAFSTAVTSPIQLASTIDIAKKLSIDGTQRINVATGALTVGSRVNIDGSRLATASTSGFKFTTDGISTSSGSSLKGLAFYGFSRGAAVEIAPALDSADITGVTIQGNLFGISGTGRVSANKIGILAQNTAGGATKAITGLTIAGNTIVRSTDSGIRLGATVANAAITGNLIGTNSARTALGNAYGIDIVGAGADNTVGAGNVIANNSTAGVRVSGTDASGGTATTIRGSELLQNAVGILVAGATNNVVVAGTTITRNTADGIRVTDTAQNVTIGGAVLADRNFIGTTSSNALGLGNARNGISVSSTGTGITIQNNAILGNGTGNVANDNAGVKLSGTDVSTALIGNAIRSNRGAGVLALGSAKATLTRNTLSSNTGSGVQVSSGTLVVGGDKAASDATLRANANTLESNGRYGVEVLAGAFAQVAGNAMNVNRLGGIFNPNAATVPVIGTVTRSTAALTNGLLTVNFTSGLTAGDVVHVYTGSAQGRVYLGQFTATGVNDKFTMTLPQQTAAGVSASVFAGAPITATKTTAAGHTSQFAAAKTIARVA